MAMRPYPRIARGRPALLLTILLAVGTSSPGCGSNGTDYCDVYCDCADCSEKERDICLARFDGEEEVAGVYECEEKHTEWVDCVIAKADCPGGEFNADECAAAENDYQECKR
jgi:hypothetical protein